MTHKANGNAGTKIPLTVDALMAFWRLADPEGDFNLLRRPIHFLFTPQDTVLIDS